MGLDLLLFFFFFFCGWSGVMVFDQLFKLKTAKFVIICQKKLSRLYRYITVGHLILKNSFMLLCYNCYVQLYILPWSLSLLKLKHQARIPVWLLCTVKPTFFDLMVISITLTLTSTVRPVRQNSLKTSQQHQSGE